MSSRPADPRGGQVGEVIVAVVRPILSPDVFAAVRSKEYSRNDSFPMSLFHKGLCFTEGCLDRLAANNGPRFGYNTIAAISVAAILDLQKSSRLLLERGQGRQFFGSAQDGELVEALRFACGLVFVLDFVAGLCFNRDVWLALGPVRQRGGKVVLIAHEMDVLTEAAQFADLCCRQAAGDEYEALGVQSEDFSDASAALG